MIAYPITSLSIHSIGWLLAAFFCGYILTQVPGGYLAQRFGAKYIFGVGVVMTAVLTIVTPLAADVNVWCLGIVRVLEGIFEVRNKGNMDRNFNFHFFKIVNIGTFSYKNNFDHILTFDCLLFRHY